MASVTLRIDGMSCGHCINAVRQALNGVPGAMVKSVQIGQAEVAVPSIALAADLEAAVSRVGYPATVVAAT